MSESHFESSKGWAVLCLVVVVAITLRVYWSAGFHPVDTAEYAKVAYQISQGTFAFDRYEGPPVIPVRTGIVFPTAAVMSLLGTGEAQIALYPLLSCAVVLVLIYLFTVRMFGQLAAAIASIAWAFLPIEIEIATTLYPEVPATAFMFIGIYCIYLARNAEAIRPRAQLLYGLAGGLAFGASWLCRESVVYLVPFCAGLLVFDLRATKFRHLPTWAGIAAGSLAVLIGEMVAYGIYNGDWLYRATATYANYRMLPEFFFMEGTRFGFEKGMPFWKAVAKRVAIDGPAMIFFSPQLLFLPAFGAIATLHALYRRHRHAYFMAALFAVMVVTFDGLSVSLRNYQPLPLFTRYFYPICFPALILTAGMLASLLRPDEGLWNALRKRAEPVFWGGAVLLVLASTVAWLTFRHFRDYTGRWSAAEEHLAGVLSPKDTIHTDAISRNGLEFFWGYPAKMNVSPYGAPGRPVTVRCGDYVLRNLSYDRWLTVNYGMWLNVGGFEAPPVVQKPPESWRVVWTDGNATLFKVTCAG